MPLMKLKSKFANNGTMSESAKLRQKKYDLKKFYGLSIAEADYLRSTYNCEICGDKAKKMVIDHEIPGTYRGVLCQQCNTRLGWVEKYKEVIEEYLERGPQNAIDQE